MGQAKRRGTYEQRKAEGIERRKREEQERQERIRQRRIEREKEEQERRAKMTPEQRRTSAQKRVLLASALTIAATGAGDIGRDIDVI